MLSFLGNLLPALFGSSSNGKGLIGSASDAIDKWIPSDSTKQKQNLENQKAGDESQKNAYSLVLPTHDSWFDILVDGLNRLPRPVLTFWAIGVLCGYWSGPNFELIHPFMLNVIWTIITFWFGARVVMKDIPAAIAVYNEMKSKKKKAKIVEKKVERVMDEIIEDDYDN